MCGCPHNHLQPGSTSHCKCIMPRGVLRYISDGDVRSPFLGLKFAI